jgi:hypothetical protein
VKPQLSIRGGGSTLKEEEDRVKGIGVRPQFFISSLHFEF